MPHTPVKFRASDLRTWASAALQAVGAMPEDAEETARVLVRTNLRGIDTHGVNRLPVYLAKIRSGEVNVRSKRTLTASGSVLTVDGNAGLGQAVAMEAVRKAADMASEAPVVTCLIRSSGHMAALGLFVLEAAERGMIALMCQETPPLMALPGATRPAIGNNPLAFAAPIEGQPPLVFDMATSVVARGNILQAILDGAETIPEGWCIGPDGQPTMDPKVALKGSMLPVAGHKGIGLAMLVQVLAGSLTGSETAAKAAANSSTSSAGNVSAFLQIINPDRLVGKETFDTHMHQWVGIYSASNEGMSRYPGQRAAESETVRGQTGIPLPESTINDLIKAGTDFGFAFDLTPIGAD